MMISRAAMGLSSLSCWPGCYLNSIRRGQEMVVWQEVLVVDLMEESWVEAEERRLAGYWRGGAWHDRGEENGS